MLEQHEMESLVSAYLPPLRDQGNDVSVCFTPEMSYVCAGQHFLVLSH